MAGGLAQHAEQLVIKQLIHRGWQQETCRGTGVHCRVCQPESGWSMLKFAPQAVHTPAQLGCSALLVTHSCAR